MMLAIGILSILVIAVGLLVALGLCRVAAAADRSYEVQRARQYRLFPRRRARVYE